MVDGLVADLDAAVALLVRQGEWGEELDDLVARAGGLDEQSRADEDVDPADAGHVHLRADLDVASACSNTFTMEWPPRSGVVVEYPEVDKVEWFELLVARTKLLPAQVELVDRLQTQLKVTSG